MEAIFERNSLYEAIHTVSAAINARSPRPSLQCIHVETRDGAAVFSATDLRIAIRCEVPVRELREPGVGLVMGAKLGGILREASEDEIRFKLGEDSAELVCGRSRFKLLTQSVQDYVELPEFPKAAVEVPAEELDKMIKRTVFAVADEPGRYAIDGVSLALEGGRLEMAATDGRRLAIAETSVGNPSAQIESCVVPKDMLARVRNMAAAGEVISLAVDKGRLLARSGGVLVAGSLIEGIFPTYRDMVPEEAGSKIGVTPAIFASKLRQASQLTTDESRAVTFRLSAGKMTIEARSASIGEGVIELDVDYSGDPLDIAFNPQFILQGLPELEAEEEGTIEVSTPDKPAVMKTPGFIYVVAPVRVRS